jgi:hypothetical protein
MPDDPGNTLDERQRGVDEQPDTGDPRAARQVAIATICW